MFFFAVIASAILDELLPDPYLEKFCAGGVNFRTILNASILGSLIPMCTCGMIPLALKLYQKGLNWKIITAFLIAGNACSIPALWLSTILGYQIVFLRFIASVLFGIFVTYLLILIAPKDFVLELKSTAFDDHHEHDCCEEPIKKKFSKKHLKKIYHDVVIMCQSFLPWIFFAVLIASYLDSTFNHGDDNLLEVLKVLSNNWLSAFVGPMISSLIAFPFYFCAGADIPISQELLAWGIPTGTVISFMLASPGLNLTSFVVYRQSIGFRKALLLSLTSFVAASLIGMIINLGTYFLE